MKFPLITISSARALAYHVRQGEPFAGITPDALANWLEEIADEILEDETGESPKPPAVKIS